MPIDAQKLVQYKEAILNNIKQNGPSLPVKIAKAINSTPLFSSAFLAELHKEQKLKLSNLRIGSSPLYYIPGQENLLEKFSDHLNQREKEAFNLLKSSKVLDDEKQTPVIRVALRAIKDFAIPARIRIKEEIKTFWRYFLVSEEEMKSILQKSLSSERKSEENTEKKENSNTQEKTEENKEKQKSEETKIEEEKNQEHQQTLSSSKEEKKNPKFEQIIDSKEDKEREKPEKEKNTQTSALGEKVREILKEKNVEILSTILEKKKEYEAKIRIDTLFGKQNYYLIAKDKKKVTENDLILALQKARELRTIALILSKGQLDKKAEKYIQDWKDLVKFEKMK